MKSFPNFFSAAILLSKILIFAPPMLSEDNSKIAPTEWRPDGFISPVEKEWNHRQCRPRTIWLRPSEGVVLELKPGTDSWRSLHGMPDLEEVHLVGDIVSIHGWLHLPQAKTIVHARELRFVDIGERASAICTTPLPPPPPAQDPRWTEWHKILTLLQTENPLPETVSDTPDGWNRQINAAPPGTNGAQAGDIIVFAQTISFQKADGVRRDVPAGNAIRLDATGGPGQDAFKGQPGKKGDDVPAVSVAQLTAGLMPGGGFIPSLSQADFHAPSSTTLSPKQLALGGGKPNAHEEIGTFIHIRPNNWTHHAEIGKKGWRDGRPAIADGKPGTGGKGGGILVHGSSVDVKYQISRGATGQKGSVQRGGAVGSPAKALSAIILSGAGFHQGTTRFLHYLTFTNGKVATNKDKHYIWEELPAPQPGKDAAPQASDPVTGGEGSFAASPATSWIDEELARLVYRHARQLHLDNDTEGAKQLIRPYVAMGASSLGINPHSAMQLAKIKTMWANLELGLDHFGHPRDWVPALQMSTLGNEHERLIKDLSNHLWASTLLESAAMESSGERELCDHLLDITDRRLQQIHGILGELHDGSLERTKGLGELERQWRTDHIILENLYSSIDFHAAEIARQLMQDQKDRGVRRGIFGGLSSIPFVGPIFALGGVAVEAADQEANSPADFIKVAQENEALLRRAYEGSRELVELHKAQERKNSKTAEMEPSAGGNEIEVVSETITPDTQHRTRVIIKEGPTTANPPPLHEQPKDGFDWDQAGRVTQRFADAASIFAEELRKSLPTQAQHDAWVAAERERLGHLLKIPGIEDRVLARAAAMLQQQQMLRNRAEQAASLMEELAAIAQQRELAGRLLAQAPGWERGRTYGWLAENMRQDIMDRLGESEQVLRRAYRYTFQRDYPHPYNEQESFSRVLDVLKDKAKSSPEDTATALRAFFTKTIQTYSDEIKKDYENRGRQWHDGFKSLQLTRFHLNQLSTLGEAVIDLDEVNLGFEGEYNMRLAGMQIESIEVEPSAKEESPSTFRLEAYGMSPGFIEAVDGKQHAVDMGGPDGIFLGEGIVTSVLPGKSLKVENQSYGDRQTDGELTGIFMGFTSLAPAKGTVRLMQPPARSPLRLKLSVGKGERMPLITSLRLKLSYISYTRGR